MYYLLLLIVVASAAPCDKVQNLAKVSVGSTQIKVSWTVPTTKPTDCVKGYRICSTPTSCATVLDATTKEYSLTSLNSCTQYNITVATLDKDNATSETVVVTASTAPGRVPGLGISRKDNDTIVALWNYDQAEGRSCATQFQLSVCDASGANCGSTTNVNVTGSVYTQDLPWKRSCRAYTLNLAVLDNNNQISDVYQAYGFPDLMDAPEKLSVLNLTSNSFEIEWAIPDFKENCDYVTHVYIKSVVNSFSYGRTIQYNGDVTKHSETGVTACTAFDVSVNFAESEDGYSTSTTAYTLPGVEKVFNNTQVQEQTSSSVLVAWSTKLTNDQCIAAYIVCWAEQSATGLACQNSTNNRNSYNITGLAANSKYQVSVVAQLHSGIEYDNATLQASTKSSSAGIFRSSLVGITIGLTLCLLNISI